MKRSINVLKNIRQSNSRRIVNRNKKKKLKDALKKVKKTKTKKSALKAYPEVQKLIDKSVQDGIIKKNTAARHKAQLMKYINTLK
jgi:small subunit ribosomal protein S20